MKFRAKHIRYIRETLSNLWITLWITGAKVVYNSVDNYVDNFRLWINVDLSTFRPQAIASYPRFCPQAQRGVLSINKANPKFIHTIHRPYYYY